MAEGAGALGVIYEQDVPTPMRDGVVLRANVMRPDAPGRFPAILVRTPYGKAKAGHERFVRAGYAVAVQDARGRYASDGDFVVFTEDQTGDDQDGYDTVEWLAEQPWCDGRVGVHGVSYPGYMAWKTAKARPPHLKALCAQSIPTDLPGLDWPGAFRPARRVHWWMTTMAPDLRRRAGWPPPHTPQEAKAIWQEIEQGRWLGFLPWADLPNYLPEPLAGHVAEWLRHPNRPAWHFAEDHREVEVPNLDFSGWFDHCNDSINHVAGMQRNGRSEVARTQTRAVLGPWSHGTLGKRQTGEIDFGPQAEVDRIGAIIRWFDRWVKDIDNGVDAEPPVRYFVMGSCQWKHAQTWPPEGMVAREYWLHSDGDAHRTEGSGALSTDAPGDEKPDPYTSDPRDPVPRLWGPNLVTITQDRRRLDYRPDILVFRTAPLEEEVETAGHAEVVLYAASSAPDTDFFARLVDDAPDGPALEACYGMVRARHRHSLDVEELLTPGEVTEFRIRLGATACRFLKGHRIRLEITSSDFPNFDRNHQTGGNDLAETEMAVARQEVHHSATFPSRLILPVDVR